MKILIISTLILAAIPALLTLLNLSVFRRLRRAGKTKTAVSVLIPARNEASNIGEALRSVLNSVGVEFEVIVLDDNSTDHTAAIVREWVATDSRVRLEQAPPLRAGWCGKQHACHCLAGHARHDLLFFMDADVRLSPDALGRMVGLMERPDAPALASGFPKQLFGSFGEKLLLPLIHFVLLGFLPMHLMRWTRWPAFSAGCGQLFITRADAYRRAGGHAGIRASLHDGVKLPRLFRRAGFATELFDATDVAECRMYQSSQETWAGLAKNATEGIAAPGTIVPMTVLLACGQVLPFLLLAASPWLPAENFSNLLITVLFAWLPRLLMMKRFAQPFLSAVLHPCGVAALLVLQWSALLRQFAGKPAQWKARSYPSAMLAVLCLLMSSVSGAGSEEILANIKLPDQFDRPQEVSFPAEQVTVISIADRHGRDMATAWAPFLRPYKEQFKLCTIADAKGTPGFLKNSIRKRIQDQHKDPLLVDWTGETAANIGYKPRIANFLIIARSGRILYRAEGEPTPTTVAAFIQALTAALQP
jgi:hypothetical protein